MAFFRSMYKYANPIETTYCYTCKVYENGNYVPVHPNYNYNIITVSSLGNTDIIVGDNVSNCANMFHGHNMNRLNYVHIGNNVTNCHDMFDTTTKIANSWVGSVFLGEKVEDITQMFADLAGYCPYIVNTTIFIPSSVKRFRGFILSRVVNNLRIYFNGETEETDCMLGERQSESGLWSSHNFYIHGCHNLIEKFKNYYNNNTAYTIEPMSDGNGYIAGFPNDFANNSWRVKLYNNYQI